MVSCALTLWASPVAAKYPTAPTVDARRLSAAGVRIVEGRHLQLLTDVPMAPALDELPRVFDAALPLWIKYFGVSPERIADGRWQACLIADRQRFAALDLAPADNPDFINGYANGWRLWLVDQPSEYYRRHLLLHEGTHAFMLTQLGSCGPGWYMEGIAELLATHSWTNGRLRLGAFPARRDDVPMWGRIKLIRDAGVAGKSWPLDQVLRIDSSRAIPTEHYAWAWALCALLDGHPQYQPRFRTLKEHVADPKFNERFRRLFAADWSDLEIEWSAYVAALDYGYDIPRMAMIHRQAAPVEAGPARRTEIAADRGWQSTGWLLRAGEDYRITASGRYRIAVDSEHGRSWPCEPGGVTIEYRDGRPLGALLGALRPSERSAESALSRGTESGDPSFAKPALIGLGTNLRPACDAVLYVRVNDAPDRLNDNEGKLALRMQTAAVHQ